MKIKISHVTNSSSASFILVIKSTTKNFEEFSNSFNRFIENFRENYRYVEGSCGVDYLGLNDFTISQDNPKSNTFEISYWTSMFNDLLTDLPGFMKELIIQHSVGNHLEDKYGIKSIKLRIDE